MAAKFILAFCASALFAQAYSQALGRVGLRTPYAYDAPCGCGAGLRGYAYDTPYSYGADIAAASALNAACGGILGVTSASAVPPTGLNVASENVYEGPLAVAGNLPFLGTVAMEGTFPSVGAGAVSYGCGNGAVGITAEGISSAGIISPAAAISPVAAIAPAAAIVPAAGLAAPLGLGYGYNGRVGACGCNGIY